MATSGITLAIRRIRSRLNYLRGYVDLSRSANRIVKRTDFSACARPVLLIYGFMATRRSFEVMEHRLRRDGYCVFSINLGGLYDAFNTRSIDETALHIARKIERLYARHRLGPLSIIAHSKGGLIGRYYVQRLSGFYRVQTLITLGTPHNGTRAAYLGLPLAPVARSIVQMTPRSAFIRELRETEIPRPVYLASIWSRRDGVCPYPVATLDPGDRKHVVNVEVDANHHELLVKKAVYDQIAAQLRAGEEWARTVARPPVTDEEIASVVGMG